MTFGVYKLVHSKPFLDHLYELWRLLSTLYSDVWKFFLYRCTSTFSALNYSSEIFFKSVTYLYEVVRTNFSTDFCIFRNFWPQFCETCGATCQQNWELGSTSERAILSEKALKTASKSSYKWQRNACSNYAPLERTARRPQTSAHDKKLQTKNIQTPCFHTYSRRTLYGLPQTLHGDRARRGHQKRCCSFSDPTHSFSCRVQGKIGPNWLTCGFSAITP